MCVLSTNFNIWHKGKNSIHSPISVHETPHSDTNSHLLRTETEKTTVFY